MTYIIPGSAIVQFVVNPIIVLPDPRRFIAMILSIEDIQSILRGMRVLYDTR